MYHLKFGISHTTIRHNAPTTSRRAMKIQRNVRDEIGLAAKLGLPNLSGVIHFTICSAYFLWATKISESVVQWNV